MEPNEIEVVIKDACILIDLVELDLLEHFFQLDLTVLSTEQVIGEVTVENQKVEIARFIENGQLQIDSEGDLQLIFDIYEKHNGLSLADSSVLELAIRKNAVVLSSDRTLRRICTVECVTTRGVLWIIQKLLTVRIIDFETAIFKLEAYKSINQRAPKKEIDEMIENFRKNIGTL